MATRSISRVENPPVLRPRLAPTPTRKAHPIGIILPAIVLVFAAILPTEVRITVAEQNLYAPRIVGFLLLPVVISRLVKTPIKFSFCDVGIVIAAAWMVFAFSVYYGPAEGVIRGGALAFDTAMPYLVARVSFRSLADIRRFLVLVAPILFAAGILMFLEVATSRYLVKPAFAELFGERAAYEDGLEVAREDMSVNWRFGLLRAIGPFPHPILAGLFIISFLPLYLNSGLRKWPYWIGTMAAVFAIFSVSSAAFIGIILNVGLLVADKLEKRIEFISWRVVIPCFVGLMLVANMMTEKGIIPWLSRFTLNPQTAHYRRLIWRYGSESVERNPWFGIGFTGYERLHWMPQTVDNHWLLIAIRYGLLPAVVLLVVALFTILSLAQASTKYQEADRKLLVGIAVSLFTFTLLGFSVAFFGGSKTWFYMLVGIGVSASLMYHNGIGLRTPLLKAPPRIIPQGRRVSPRAASARLSRS